MYLKEVLLPITKIFNAMKTKLKLGLTLFILGFLGVLTMLTSTIGDIPEDMLARFSPIVVKLLMLASPTIMLLIMVTVGTILYDKVNLSVPTISTLLKIESPHIKFTEQLKYGIILGVIAGLLIMCNSYLFAPVIPEEFNTLAEKVQVTLLTRFGYGGITEELLIRFGLMTLIVWITSKITKRLNNYIYWFAIIVTSILFGLGHFPAVFQTVGSPGMLLLLHTLIGNSIAGLFCGWLYWKKGLESAMIAHMFVHVVLVSIGLIV